MFAPNGKIGLIENIQFDAKYENIFDFSSKDSQYTYFYNKVRYWLDDVSYSRKDSTMKVPYGFEELWGVNYVMYQNETLGKWVYAFISDKRYINDDVTEIVISTDVMQTYMFDYVLLSSFVEREHIVGDSIGANLIPEGLELGEYILNSAHKSGVLQELYVLVGTTISIGELSPISGSVLMGTYSGVRYYAYPLTSVNELNNALNMLTESGKSDAIVSISMIPKAFLPFSGNNGGMITLAVPNYNNVLVDKVTSLDGYTPRNKKLLTYPYCLISVINHLGNHAEYMQEFFSGSQCEFTITGNIGPDCTAILLPKNYKGVAQNNNDAFTLNNFPQCSWNIDTYKVWLAQNSVSNMVGMSATALTTASGLASGNPMMVASGMLGVANLLGEQYKHSIMPPQAQGNVNGSGVNVAIGLQDFEFLRMSITYNQAKIIDDFFHMYGYKTNKLKVPNTRTRSVFNYVKTIGCNIRSGIDQKDLIKIKEVYDKGVTIWHNQNINYNVVNGEV